MMVIFRNGRMRRKVGLVDKETVLKAGVLDIDIEAGTIAKSHGHVTALKSARELYPGKSVLRSHLVWWLNTEEIVDGEDIHHKNTNKIDDRFTNLEHLKHIDHLHHHNPKGLRLVSRVCHQCGTIFQIDKWRLKDRSRGRFCSQNCYQAHPRSDESRKRRSQTLLQMYASGWRNY